jgi:hypothetical protein
MGENNGLVAIYLDEEFQKTPGVLEYTTPRVI